MINFEMNGKIVLVTGGTQGLGKGIAKKFLESGATVIIVGRNDEKGVKAQDELKAHGQIEYVKADISVEEQVKALISHIVNKYGRLDCAINNAAGFNPVTPLHETSLTDVQRVINVDLMGTFICMKYEIEQMLKQPEKGCIVNTSSIVGEKPLIGLMPYNAAKAGVNAMTKTAALDYAAEGIRINAVCPGIIETEALAETRVNDPAAYARYASSTPMNIISSPSDIAGAVIWLCSEAAGVVTGALVNVDGGAILK